MADRDVRTLRIEILDTMTANGRYLLPIGFAYEQPRTNLHKAIRELKDLGFIKCKGLDGLGFEEWVQS